MANSPASRPTLPSIHSLDLPTLNLREKMRFSDLHDSYNHPMPTRTGFHPRGRETSVSSSITDISCSSVSPSPSDLSVSTATELPIHYRPSSVPVESCRLRLVRSSIENVDAVLVIPPPTAPSLSTAPSSNVPQQVRALLLIGSAMHQHFRHPQRSLPRGARIHPYRFIRADAEASMKSSSTSARP